MKKIHASLISLMALALVVGSGVKDAKAEFKVTATVTTPNVRVHVRNTPDSHYRSYTTRYTEPTCVISYYRPSPYDRAIAIRLSNYTGVSPRELIGMKRHGLNWVQIGRRIGIAPNVVIAARNERTWNRFMHTQCRFAKRTVRGMKHGWNRAAFGDGDFYEDDDGVRNTRGARVIKANEITIEQR